MSERTIERAIGGGVLSTVSGIVSAALGGATLPVAHAASFVVGAALGWLLVARDQVARDRAKRNADRGPHRV